MSLLDVSHLSVTRRNRPILKEVSFSIGRGEVVGLIGPNGAGKTTLMRAALGLLPFTGAASLAAMPARARAQQAAWLPQSREIAWPVDVQTLVALGRLPHLTAGQKPTSQDQEAIDQAIRQMGLEQMRTRTATRLSGGEQARVLIARVLAQQTPLILTDEPIAGLDPAHQISTMRVFSDLARSGQSVFVSLHDLGLAARHCTRLILLSEGRIAADGAPKEVLTPENLCAHFGVNAHFEEGPQGAVFQALDIVP